MVLSISQIKQIICVGLVVAACMAVTFPLDASAQTAEPGLEPSPNPSASTVVPETTDTTVIPPSSVSPEDSTPTTTETASEAPPSTTIPEQPPTDSTTTSTLIEPTTTVEQLDAAEGERSRGGYSSQPPFVPDSVNPAKVEAARQKLAKANLELAEASKLIETRDETLESINSQVDQLAGETSEMINQSANLRTDVHNMAVANFRNPTLGFPKPDVEDPSDAIVYRRLVAFVASRNDEMADQFDLLHSQLSDEERQLVAETSRLSGERNQAQVLFEQRTIAVEQAEIELETYEAAGEFYVPNAVFPIAAGYDMPLINSYGFDRARGTADSHWHEGIDIFGPRGTELYAAETGVITNVGSGRLGGLVISLVGDSGTRWYYAHLDGFAPGLSEGQVVQAGDVIGYLGDSGNARGTPPHLHLEIHPPEIRVINPYPQLNVLAQRDLVTREQNQIDGDGSGQKVSIS